MLVLFFWNLAVFLIYGIDKYKARRNLWRISEKMLLTCAILMGGVGAFVGMEVFRHKTKKMAFKIMVPTLAVVQIAVICYGRI